MFTCIFFKIQFCKKNNNQDVTWSVFNCFNTFHLCPRLPKSDWSSQILSVTGRNQTFSSLNILCVLELKKKKSTNGKTCSFSFGGGLLTSFHGNKMLLIPDRTNCLRRHVQQTLGMLGNHSISLSSYSGPYIILDYGESGLF